ncbi:hypothetical protein GWK47_026673 [Chionoecetes opilio]|uniref:Uncharacterized protein n=1 Tax=Chionoecetes opilio TaxID=41210 RepID=A0A8J8WCW6_CHIOP|nr:hypothetical protein GWK47_026673 [Chionoecetes opilio]
MADQSAGTIRRNITSIGKGRDNIEVLGLPLLLKTDSHIITCSLRAGPSWSVGNQVSCRTWAPTSVNEPSLRTTTTFLDYVVVHSCGRQVSVFVWRPRTLEERIFR